MKQIICTDCENNIKMKDIINAIKPGFESDVLTDDLELIDEGFGEYELNISTINVECEHCETELNIDISMNMRIS